MRVVEEKEKKVQRGISLCPELFEKIEELRGFEDRSHFVERMVRMGIFIQNIVLGKQKVPDDLIVTQRGQK